MRRFSRRHLACPLASSAVVGESSPPGRRSDTLRRTRSRSTAQAHAHGNNTISFVSRPSGERGAVHDAM